MTKDCCGFPQENIGITPKPVPQPLPSICFYIHPFQFIINDWIHHSQHYMLPSLSKVKLHEILTVVNVWQNIHSMGIKGVKHLSTNQTLKS
jgi:hypothetical protein